MTHKIMLINAREKGEIRVAILVNGILDDYHIERTSRESLVGRIYKGVVKDIHPGLQSCFVDIGLERTALLHVSEVIRPQGKPLRIEKLLSPNQDIFVQLKRDSFGDKGPLITMHTSIAGRFFILTPFQPKLLFSKKIQSANHRSFLSKFIKSMNLPQNVGIVVRTHAIFADQDEIENDLLYLLRVWKAIDSRYKSQRAPCLLYQEPDIVIKTLREYFFKNISEVIIDEPEAFEKAKEFFSSVLSKYIDRLKFYQESAPLFYNFQVEEQINQLTQTRIKLPSGGMITIEQTEALTAIDVNSESYISGRDAEELAFKVNYEATIELMRQIRLRDIGGIIVVDYIHMKDRRNIEKIQAALHREMQKDRAQMAILPISDFCLAQIARQKTKPSLRYFSYTKCPTCDGSGFVKTAESLGLELLRHVKALVQRPEIAVIEIHANQNTLREFTTKGGQELEKLERDFGKKIYSYEIQGEILDRAEMICYNAEGEKLAEYKT